MVYLDHSRNPFGRMVMCHMIADTPAELRTMALAIGLALRWFQARSSMPHFDVTLSKRGLALERGAIALDRRAFVEAMRRIRVTWPRIEDRWII